MKIMGSLYRCPICRNGIVVNGKDEPMPDTFRVQHGEGVCKPPAESMSPQLEAQLTSILLNLPTTNPQ